MRCGETFFFCYVGTVETTNCAQLVISKVPKKQNKFNEKSAHFVDLVMHARYIISDVFCQPIIFGLINSRPLIAFSNIVRDYE